MEVETSFLIVAALLLFLDVVFLSDSGIRKKRRRSYGLYATIVAFGLIVISYLTLLRALVGDDFSLVEVYSYSSSGLPLVSKIYASWGGARGSMLFLTFLLSILYVLLRFSGHKKADDFNITASRVFNIMLIVFIAVCLVKNPFERFAVAPVEGRGLNPQLQSVWMAIHPPIVFSAYVLVLLAFALTLASMKTARELSGIRVFRCSTYAAWMLLTLGIALGGVWAYEVLGWGGYWAWDPVETASLVPWLLFTAYFHVDLLAKRLKSYSREFMMMITFASLIFLSALTRGGFKQSVHAYAISPVGPIMLVFALGMLSYFFHLRRKERRPLFRLQVDRSSLRSRSAFIGFWSLVLIALVCLAGLAFADFPYSYWTFPFVLAFVVGLIGCSLNESARLARLVLLVTLALVAGLAVVLLPFPAINLLTRLSFPLMILASLTTISKVIRGLWKKSVRLLGRSLLHFAIVVLLTGVFVSAGAKTTSTVVTEVQLDVPIEASSMTLVITNVTTGNSTGTIYSDELDAVIPEYSFAELEVEFQHLGKTRQGILWAGFYPNYGLVLRPLIVTTMTGDVYIHLDYTDSLANTLVHTLIGNRGSLDEIAITVQTSPMVYLVWTGIALMITGIALQLGWQLSAGGRKAYS